MFVSVSFKIKAVSTNIVVVIKHCKTNYEDKFKHVPYYDILGWKMCPVLIIQD